MKNNNICIIGNLNIDIIIRNVPSLPVWGQEIIGDSHIIVSSGQAGYLGFALSNLDIPTSIIGNVGDDYYGHMILKDLNTHNINTDGVEILNNAQTCICVAIGRTDGERAFVSDYASLSEFSKSLVLKNWGIVESSSIVCIVGTATLANFTLDNILEIARKAKQGGKNILLDTGWYPSNFNEETVQGIKSLLSHISIFLPNMDEARAITGCNTPEEASEVLQSYGAEIVVIKCGDKGSVARNKSDCYHFPAIPTKALDAVGAGDVYNSGFLYGYQNNLNIVSCMAIGSAAASLYISRISDRFPSLIETLELASKFATISAD